MYSKLYTTIENSLDNCDTIAKVWSYPTSDFEGQYPAAVVYPDELKNSFADVKNYKKIYRFKLWIVVGVMGDTNTNEVFNTILADAVDDVIDQFDNDWDGGTIDGHRVTKLVNSGAWGLRDTQNELTAVAELNIRIKVHNQ